MIYLTLAHFRHFRHPGSLLTNSPSTTVENVRQISPFYAKQSQFQKESNERKLRDNNEICKFERLAGVQKQTQFKANKAKNKPNSNPNKPNLKPVLPILSLSKETQLKGQP
jgi:hypothetical protein